MNEKFKPGDVVSIKPYDKIPRHGGIDEIQYKNAYYRNPHIIVRQTSSPDWFKLRNEEFVWPLHTLEMSIDDLAHQMEMLVKLKVLNKKYYERASKEEAE